VNEEVTPIFVRRITSGLDRLARGVARAGIQAAVFELIGECVFAEILFRVELASGFEHEHGHSAFGEHFRRPASRSPGADNNSVIDFAPRSLHGLFSSENRIVVPPSGGSVRCRHIELYRTLPPEGGATNYSLPNERLP